MPKNNIRYNSQGLFVAPYSGEYTYYSIPNHRILKRIEKIQSFNYTIQNSRLDLNSFGSNFRSYQSVAGAPNIPFAFEYISDGMTNENRLNFSVGHFQDPIMGLMFSGICNSGFMDKKDFYLAIHKDNKEANTFTSISNSSLEPSQEAHIINQKSKDYGLLHFQNCYLIRYSFDSFINNFSRVRQEYIADNLVFYLSGSGINYTILNTKSGFQEIQADKIVVPSSFNYNDPQISGQNILLPGDASINFETQNSTGSNFYSEHIQGFNFQVDFQRRDVRNLNNKFTIDRPIIFPITAALQTELLVSGDISGSFFDTLDHDKDYNIIVNFKANRSHINPTKFIFSGCKFDNINYTSSIGEDKRASLTFILDIDSNFATKGIFTSGNVLYGINTSNAKKVLMY